MLFKFCFVCVNLQVVEVLLFFLFASRLFKFCFVCVNLQVIEVLLLSFCLPPWCLSCVLFVLTSRLLKCCCCFLFTSRLVKFCFVCVNLQVVEVLLLSFCLPPGC